MDDEPGSPADGPPPPDDNDQPDNGQNQRQAGSAQQRYGKERVANMIDLLDEIVGDDMWSTPALRRAA